MKLNGKKFIATGCALAMTVSSLTGFAQTAPQEKEKPRKQVEKTETIESDVFIFRSEEGDHDVFRNMSPRIQRMMPMIGTPGMRVAPFGGQAFAFGQQGPAPNIEFLSSEMSFSGKVVKGAPYSAEAVTETVQTLMDGNRIVRRNSSQVYRDSEGRTRRESTVILPGWVGNGDSPKMIHISDPVTDTNYVLNPKDRTASKMQIRIFRGAELPEELKMKMQPLPRKHRSEGTGEGTIEGKVIKLSSGTLQGSAVKRVPPIYPPVAKAAKVSGAVQVQVFVDETGKVMTATPVSGHPLLRESAIDAAEQWVFKPATQAGQSVKSEGLLTFNFSLAKNAEGGQEPAQGFSFEMASGDHFGTFWKHEAKKESLGEQTVEGVKAQGTRWTTTIPAGEVGNERAIEIIHEEWFSPELQVTVMRRNYDPRSGETIYKLTNISRAEPDKSLFEVPSDYTVKEGGGYSFSWKSEKKDDK